MEMEASYLLVRHIPSNSSLLTYRCCHRLKFHIIYLFMDVNVKEYTVINPFKGNYSLHLTYPQMNMQTQ